jgi:hypothetical protein
VKEPTFDIFSGESEKDAVWMEAAEGLSKARVRIEEIAAGKPGKYFLFASTSQTILARVETFNSDAKSFIPLATARSNGGKF